MTIGFFVENFDKIIHGESIDTCLEESLKSSLKDELTKLTEDLTDHEKQLKSISDELLELATKNMLAKFDSSNLIPVSFEKTISEGKNGISTLVYSKDSRNFEKRFTSFCEILNSAEHGSGRTMQ